MTTPADAASPPPSRRKLSDRLLDGIERVGNKLPDPALLFVYALLIVWVVSALLDGTGFSVPGKDGAVAKQVESQLTGKAITTFLADMVKTFTSFHPLGVVLVALLGVGVAEHSGFINAALKRMVAATPNLLLTPMIILIALVSHTTADAGYVLVIPLAGVIYHAAGRHPLAGIAAAFAGVSGGFSANPAPSSLDPMLQGLTQSAAALIDPSRVVNPLGNWIFTATSSLVIMAIGWYVTDRVIEPRLARTPVDADASDLPKAEALSAADRRGLRWGGLTFVLGLATLIAAFLPAGSPLRSPAGSLTAADAPLMKAIVALIFLLFLLPGLVHGYVAGTFRDHRDVIKAMARSMSGMGYYLVMAFFASLFIYSFDRSQLGVLLAVEGASALKSAALPAPVTVVGIILLSAFVNLLIGSASAKWGLLAPIFVPMLMQLGIAPELTQAAYRVGDSTTNIITPLMPYFPLVVAYAQRYVKKTGIGTLTALMLPYSMAFLVLWTLYLLAFWGLGIPLGIGSAYSYP
jgi:aminobenzoyl-glutamate transport protein